MYNENTNEIITTFKFKFYSCNVKLCNEKRQKILKRYCAVAMIEIALFSAMDGDRFV